VTNLSSNPLYVDKESIAKGATRTLAKDQLVSFARLEGNTHVHFIKLQVREPAAEPASEPSIAHAQISSHEARRGTVAASSIQPLSATPPVPASVPGPACFSPATSPPKFRPEPRDNPAAREAAAYRQQAATPPAPAPVFQEEKQPQARDSPVASPNGSGDLPGVADGGTEIILELCGLGVLDVGVEQRRIGPMSLKEPLVVGRRHQPDMHRAAVDQEWLAFVSRDHFRVSYENGRYQLCAMTSNPIWRKRGDAQLLELQRGEVATLASGDHIVLGTGSSPEDACKRLYWKFNVAGERTPLNLGKLGMDAASGGGDTPPTPGGPGPRISSMIAASAASAASASRPGGAGGGGRGGASGAAIEQRLKAAQWTPLLPPAEEESARLQSQMLPAEDLEPEIQRWMRNEGCADGRRASNNGSGGFLGHRDSGLHRDVEPLEVGRPSEVCGLAPRLLPVGKDSSPSRQEARERRSAPDESGGLPCFGQGIGGALRAPVWDDDDMVKPMPKASSMTWSEKARAGEVNLDITERKDEFSKSGFRF